MTYRELAWHLSHASEEQLDQDVTVWFMETNEFVPVLEAYTAEEEDDVLDEEHIALGIER